MGKTKKTNKRIYSFLLPLLLITVIGISGCTTIPGGGATGNGVAILEFLADFPELRSNEEVNLKLEIQNMGDAKAINVRAELTGISPEDWGSFINVIQVGDLLAADAQAGTVGATRQIQWNRLFAPYLVKGTEFTYTPTVRVSYDYTTTAQKPITIVDQEELRRIIAAGESLTSGTTTQSAGPLNIQITTGNYVKSSGAGFGTTYDIFPINIKISNPQFSSGNTVVKPLSGFGPETYPIILRIDPPSGTNFVYSGYGSDCSQFVVIDLFQGRDTEITCELEVTNPPSIKQEGLITINLEYRYAIDASTSIKVFGI